jgi:hypothetical protein
MTTPAETEVPTVTPAFRVDTTIDPLATFECFLDESPYETCSRLKEYDDLEEGQYIGWASFSGKCTYVEQGWEVMEGSHLFMICVEDWDEPGAGYDKL